MAEVSERVNKTIFGCRKESIIFNYFKLLVGDLLSKLKSTHDVAPRYFS